MVCHVRTRFFQTPIIHGTGGDFFCCAALVYLSASFRVRQPKIAISWWGVAPFSAAITAPALCRPCAVR